MIDWASLVFNSLWILGAAIILAALSHSFYQAQRGSDGLRVALNAPTFQIGLAAGLALISLSLALIGPCWWRRVLGAGLCGLSLWQLWDAVQLLS